MEIHVVQIDANPSIFVQVTIEELNVNSPVVNKTLYAAGATESAQVQVPSIATGTIHYYVEDTSVGRVLFDYTMTFELPGVDASAAYINPDL